MRTTAIIVGVSKYNDESFETLPGAQADANRFASALTSWGLPREWIHLLHNEQATKANFIKTFYDRRSDFDADAKLIFYFAGHGIRESDVTQGTTESALVLHDSNYEDPLSTGLRLVELMQLIRALKPVQVFLFIDACSLRLNQIDNPLNEGDVLSTTNSQGLFCLFSSGIHKSYEDARLKYGYFTNALLKAIAELRHDKEANCHDIFSKVSINLKEHFLPPPEMYQIGFDKMWLLEECYEHHQAEAGTKNLNTMVLRRNALAQLQDHLVSLPDPVIWMWGEGGKGKTVIAEQLSKRNPSVVYASIPNIANTLGSSLASIIEQIRLQKSELFFNRPPESSLYQILLHVASHHTNSILIFDHLDRLGSMELEVLITELDQIPLPSILISRYPCPLNLFKKRRGHIVEWPAASLTLEEIEKIILTSNLDPSLSSVLLNATQGNALKVRQMLVKLSGQDILTENNVKNDLIKCMVAVVACGGFLDEILFCRTFRIKTTLLTTLERLGLIRYTKEGCYPHDLLIEMVEEHQWSLDLYQGCLYWNRQISETPYNRWACRSLVLLASQLESCKSFKTSLGQCLETLNEKEYLPFLIDLVHIFKREKWEGLLLKSTDYLIDHEEYKRVGEELLPLRLSAKPSIRNHALKNEARRLVWLGRFSECIALCNELLSKPGISQIVVSLKNYMGISHYFLGNMSEAMLFFRENIHSKGKKDNQELAMAKYMTGIIMTYRGESVPIAKEMLESSVQIFESTKFFLGVILALNGLGLLSYSIDQWSQSLYYFKKAEDIVKAMQNETFLLFTMNNIARSYLRLFGSRSQKISLLVEEMETLLIRIRKLGTSWVTMMVQNTLATVYAHRKEIKKLEMILNEVTPLTENYQEFHIFTLANLSLSACLKNNDAQARSYYQEAIALAKKQKNALALHEITLNLQGYNLTPSPQEFYVSQIK